MILTVEKHGHTGQLFDALELRWFIDAVPKDVFVCVDEADVRFVDDPDYSAFETISISPDNKDLPIEFTEQNLSSFGGSVFTISAPP